MHDCVLAWLDISAHNGACRQHGRTCQNWFEASRYKIVFGKPGGRRCLLPQLTGTRDVGHRRHGSPDGTRFSRAPHAPHKPRDARSINENGAMRTIRDGGQGDG